MPSFIANILADTAVDPSVGGFLPLVGALAVYVFREVYKDFKYNKIRANEREERIQGEESGQRSCQFDDSQRERIFNLINGARNRDELIKDVIRDQDNILKSIDRLVDRLDALSDELSRRRRE